MSLEVFKENLTKININLNDDQITQFNEYYRILIIWNEFMNLTGITDYEEVLLKHYVDSLAVNIAIKEEKWNLNNKLKVIDIGTGAGFPGLPLKIAFEHLDVTLMDSLNKRIKFLNEVIDNLKLTGIHAVHGRAEDYAKDIAFRENFDLCVSRAVSNLATLCEYCLPYVRVGGLFIAYKSGQIDEELEQSRKAIYILGGKVVDVIKFTLPGSDIDRSFVRIEKIRSTAKAYPRKAGLPSKEPLS